MEKIYDGNSLWFDTGYLFSANHDRNPDIVMVDYKRKEVHLMDGRNGYELTSLPFNGVPWNVKVLPFTDGERDAFVVAAAKSPSLFWSFQWRGGAYEVRKEKEHKGNYEHPLDGTFTIADVDGDGQKECVVPDSSKDKRAKGLSYLEAVPMTKPTEPENQFQLND